MLYAFLCETEQNVHLHVDFILPDFVHAPQMDFLWTGQSGGPPYGLRSNAQVSAGSLQREKKTVQQLVIE